MEEHALQEFAAPVKTSGSDNNKASGQFRTLRNGGFGIYTGDLVIRGVVKPRRFN
jgi:hypothetical protein